MKKIICIFLIIVSLLLVSCNNGITNTKIDNIQIQNDDLNSIDKITDEKTNQENNNNMENNNILENTITSDDTLIVEDSLSDINEEILELNEEEKIDTNKIAHYSLSSTPSDAQVFIDKKFIGNTPINFDVEYGLKRLEIKKDNYVDYFLMTSINKDETKKLNIKLVKDVGYLDVSSIPSKAMIYVNGRYLGKTHMILNATAGENNLTLKYDGYENFNVLFSITAKKMNSINAELIKK